VTRPSRGRKCRESGRDTLGSRSDSPARIDPSRPTSNTEPLGFGLGPFGSGVLERLSEAPREPRDRAVRRPSMREAPLPPGRP
jgi:hypothetical protein